MPSPDASTATHAPGRRHGEGLVRRLLFARTIGWGCAGLMIAAPLHAQGAAATLWVMLAASSLAWPWLAAWRARRHADAPAAERSNVLVDGLLAGCWMPVVGVAVLPATSLGMMAAMNGLVTGGPPLLRRVAAVVVAAALGTALALHSPVTFATGPAIDLAALPFLVAYPATVGVLHWQLSSRLARGRMDLQASERFYHDTLDAIEAGIVLYDPAGRVRFCNADFRRLYAPLADVLHPGTPFETVIRAAVERGLMPEAAGRENAWIADRLAAHRAPGQPAQRLMPDGRWRRILEQRLPDGSVLAFSSDVTELVAAAEALAAAQSQAERQRALLQLALDTLPDAVALWDASDRLIVWNGRYEAMAGKVPGTVVRGASYEQVLRGGLAAGHYPDAAGREADWLAARLRAHRQSGAVVVQPLRGNRWIRVHERTAPDGSVAGVRTDITDLVRREQALRQAMAERDDFAARLQEANARLETLATTDPLTGLPNRRHLDERLAEEWHRALRHALPLSALMVDVDHFKALNDHIGHAAGDECLRRVADALREAAGRGSDFVARYGGEEFVVLLPHADEAEAEAAAGRCRDALARAALPHAASPVGPTVTVSIGVATLAPGGMGAPGGDTPASLLRQADQGLYRAKRAGRDRWARGDDDGEQDGAGVRNAGGDDVAAQRAGTGAGDASRAAAPVSPEARPAR